MLARVTHSLASHLLTIAVPMLLVFAAVQFLAVAIPLYVAALSCKNSGEHCFPGPVGFIIIGVPALVIGEGFLCAAAVAAVPRYWRLHAGVLACATAASATILMITAPS